MATAEEQKTGTTKPVVVAIDFGTTYSGYAYSYQHSPLEIFNTLWSKESLLSHKTSTCVLLKPNETFHSFGYEAEDKYAQLAEDKQNRDWFFFRRFKMMLYDTSSITEDTMLPDISGKELPAVVIFAHAIRYLKEHLQSALKIRTGHTYDSQIQYVLTVPAIWDDKAKIFMRKAAVNAGIQGEHLRMVLEPEAASLWCQVYANERHVNISRKYIVVDLGGGTADITVQEQDEEDNLKELHQATGGPWGGITVDNNLENILSHIFGSRTFEKLKVEDMDCYLSILSSFERSKRNMKMENNTATVTIPLMLLKQFSKWNSFFNMFNTKRSDRKINKRIGALGLTDKCRIRSEKLKVDISMVRHLFRYAIDSLVGHLKSLFKKDNIDGVDTILLVGGFAESAIVQEWISEAFPGKTVITPNDSGLAVLKGAVRFGHFPRLIAARKSKFFYGLRTSTAFDPNKHPENKRTSMHGKDFCCNLFSEIVAQGEDLLYGKEFSKERIAADVAQTYVTETLFASTSPNTLFVDEEGCIEIGQIRIDYPQSDNKDDKECTVFLSFWDTEIKFRVQVNGSTEVYEKRFDRL